MRSILIIGVLFVCLHSNANESVPSNLVLLGDGSYYSHTALIVDKVRRVLEVWQKTSQLSKIKSYPIDLGKMNGDKSSQNDHRTPEGMYHFLQMLEGSNLDFKEYGVRAFTMNYPNYFDIRERKTGSGIWLHAVPDEKGLQRGSRGCIVVNNDAIKDVSQYITLKRTPIIVNENVNYITLTELDKEKQQVIDWTKSWLRAWQTKHIDEYMGFYHEDFNSRKMSKSQWRVYKDSLNKMYQNIKIQISEPFVTRHGDKWEISFLQKYASSNFEDFGEKTLFVRGPTNDLKIIAEEFENTRDSKALSEFNRFNYSCCGEQLSSN